MDTVKTGHPKGLYLLFMTEMWERFSYYGMRALFILFLTKALFFDRSLASTIYGSYTGLVYLTPLLGGYISDKFWGNRKSILIGGILMAIGQFAMFFSGSSVTEGLQNNTSVTAMWIGLTLLIIGNGFFKPNISTMVGQLYPKGDHRVDGAFTIFYMGINAGAFIAPLICGFLGDTNSIYDFKWGFLAAGVGMVLSVIFFEVFKHKYLVTDSGEPIGMPKAKLDIKTIAVLLSSVGLIFFFLNFQRIFNSDLDIIGYLIYASMLIMPIVILSDKSLQSDEKQRITVIFILAFFVIFFWACFEQAGASLTLFADTQTNRNLFGWEMPASYFQSINPLAIIVLAPIFSSFWGFLHNRKAEPSSPLKMSMGLALLALGYIVIAIGVFGVTDKISMWWLVALYVLHTMGELCLSPIGLSMVSKLAPVRLSSLLMGTWFLANAAANKFAGTLSALIPPGAGEEASSEVPSIFGFEISDLFSFFMVFIVLSGSAAFILVFLRKWLEGRMHGVK